MKDENSCAHTEPIVVHTCEQVDITPVGAVILKIKSTGYGIKTLDRVLDLVEPLGRAALCSANAMAYALYTTDGGADAFCAILSVPHNKDYTAFRAVVEAFFDQLSPEIMIDGLIYKQLRRMEQAQDAAAGGGTSSPR